MKIEKGKFSTEQAEGRKIYIGIVLPNKLVRYIHCEGEDTPFSVEDILSEDYKNKSDIMSLMQFKHIKRLPEFRSELPNLQVTGDLAFNTYDVTFSVFIEMDNAIWGGRIGHNTKYLWVNGEWYFSIDMGNIRSLNSPNILFTRETFMDQKGLS